MADERKRGLGRIYAPDSRDMDYPMHLALHLLKQKAVVDPQSESRYWETGDVLDQKESNHCVGFSLRSYLDAAPIKTVGGLTGDEVYYAAKKLDGLNSKDIEEGTSVRAGIKALSDAGHIKQYVWAYDVETIATFLLTQGTVVVGTNWYSQMDNPSAGDGYLLHPRGNLEGGHAWHLVGVDRSTRIFRMKNSWGTDWGKDGFAYISFNDLSQLLRESGEAVAAIEQVITNPVR